MIFCKFYYQENKICGFTFSGHSGYAKAGSDIVCAAVSSAAQFAVCGISEIIGQQCDISMENGVIQCFLTGKDKKKLRECGLFLKTLEVFVRQLESQYKEFIKVSIAEV